MDCGGACPACAPGKACKASADCAPNICDKNLCRQAASCKELAAAHKGLKTGTYTIKIGTTTRSVYCEMTINGGGWTLIGSVVNSVTRKWNTIGAFTGTTTWGSVAAAKTDNFKSALWASHKGDDLMVQTPEYAFGFNKLLGSAAFATYISKNWTSKCTNKWVRSGADFATNLSTAQQKTLSFNIRPHDVNNGCFPGFAEAVVIGFVAFVSSIA